jgi:hypothetical protein
MLLERWEGSCTVAVRDVACRAIPLHIFLAFKKFSDKLSPRIADIPLLLHRVSVLVEEHREEKR